MKIQKCKCIKESPDNDWLKDKNGNIIKEGDKVIVHWLPSLLDGSVKKPSKGIIFYEKRIAVYGLTWTVDLEEIGLDNIEVIKKKNIG